MMVQELILGAEQSSAPGARVLSEIGVFLNVNLNLMHVIGGEVRTTSPLARVDCPNFQRLFVVRL